MISRFLENQIGSNARFFDNDLTLSVSLFDFDERKGNADLLGLDLNARLQQARERAFEREFVAVAAVVAAAPPWPWEGRRTGAEAAVVHRAHRPPPPLGGLPPPRSSALRSPRLYLRDVDIYGDAELRCPGQRCHPPAANTGVDLPEPSGFRAALAVFGGGWKQL